MKPISHFDQTGPSLSSATPAYLSVNSNKLSEAGRQQASEEFNLCSPLCLSSSVQGNFKEGFRIKPIFADPTIGETLTTERVKRRLSLETVCQKLQLTSKYLQALEEDNFDVLPGEIYLKNFIRKLSNFYQLNNSVIEEQLAKQLTRQESQIEKSNNSLRVKFSPKRAVLLPKIISRAGWLAVGVIIFGYLGWQTVNSFIPPNIELEEPTNGLVTTEATINIVGRIKPAAQVFVNNERIFTDEEGYFSHPLTLKAGLNNIKIQAKKKFSSFVTLSREVYYEAPTIGKTVLNNTNEAN